MAKDGKGAGLAAFSRFGFVKHTAKEAEDAAWVLVAKTRSLKLVCCRRNIYSGACRNCHTIYYPGWGVSQIWV